MKNSPLQSSKQMRKKRILMQLKSDWPLYVLIFPAVVYVFLLNYIPMSGVQIAFKNYRTSKGI